MDGESLSEFFEQSETFDETNLAAGAASDPDDIFSVLEALEDHFNPLTRLDEAAGNFNSSSSKDHHQSSNTRILVSQKSTSSSALQLDSENELEMAASPKCKRQKLSSTDPPTEAEANHDGQQKMSHIAVERNRRKQMNEHLTVLRSLMPCFYVKRGDQASIIGGVVDYISELQQVLQSLEAKKQRKVYSEVLSPRISSCSPRAAVPLSPRKPLPISPRTPQPPYKPRLPPLTTGANYLSPTLPAPLDPSPSSSSTNSSIDSVVNELVANSKSAIAEVEVKFSGPNVLLKTVSPRIPGQTTRIVSALQQLSLQILHLNISTVNDETMLTSFTIKIGIECQLSAEELAQLIQQTFC